MDERTLRYYDAHAPELAERYASVQSPLGRYFGVAFPEGARVVDVGAGVGREVAHLLRDGYEAYGVEPTAGLRGQAVARHPELDGRLWNGTLPDGLPEAEALGAPFDGVVCSAVLQHVPRPRMFDAAFAIKGLLRERGRVLLSVPVGREVGAESRDEGGRLFSGVTGDEIELLFERLGFASIGRWRGEDSLGRPGHRWDTLLFELRSGGQARPVDLIEGVLSRRERKVATYKLALIRALCDIALTQPHRAQFREDMVGVPIEAVAERWVTYYWPLFESPRFLPQMNGEWGPQRHQLAFAGELEALIDGYRQTGQLPAFELQRRHGTLPEDVRHTYEKLLTKLKRTIHAGPVTYAGGSHGSPLFDYDRGVILVLPPVWRELSLMGHWIQDALVLRWAHLVHQLSGREVPTEDVVARLVVQPLPERETSAAREVFAAAPAECVWTGQPTTPRSLHIDHVLPYALWHNNDLWNLLPTHAQVNQAKSDKLPTRALLFDRRHAILSCWARAQQAFPARFAAEAAAQTGELRPALRTLFQVMAESVEVTALQRGWDRWPP